ncbi:hypothetical protein BA190_15900 [Labrys sp. WJW]|uniref:hypothetical protein n=1 Tax=Labrys sp. WJW TaxID=1737983 RepID=UPI000837A77D|nr:hypothetical protein [Labrys sp. WJW]OCC03974.1 hypothetical protein BA190_15900 [Labrys sp. WJW]
MSFPLLDGAPDHGRKSGLVFFFESPWPVGLSEDESKGAKFLRKREVAIFEALPQKCLSSAGFHRCPAYA